MKKCFRISVLTLTALLFHFSSFAQCAMCRVTIENNVANGETNIAAGLNLGILYLLVMPYLLVMTVGYFWYRNSKKKKANLTIR